MAHFVMVHTTSSGAFTPHAIRTLAASEALEEGDTFELIDNDGSFDRSIIQEHLPTASVTINQHPKSFAANMNMALRRSLDPGGVDVFLLNNDLIFSKGWRQLVEGTPDMGICSPLGNQQVAYAHRGLYLQRTVSLAAYTAVPEDVFPQIAAHHTAVTRMAKLPTLVMPFFCVRIGRAVVQQLGLLDEEYGRGGAEDSDYCLRAALAGIPLGFAPKAYVLHFSGKSTWDGAENKEQTDARCREFRERFLNRWGESLTRLVIDYDNSVLARSRFQPYVQCQDMGGLVKALMQEDGVTNEYCR